MLSLLMKILGEGGMKFDMRRTAVPFAVSCAIILVAGCAPRFPFKSDVTEAYRVDPVMVQTDRNKDAQCADLSSQAEQGTGASGQRRADTLCGIDLAIYVFPFDPQPKRTAYSRLLQCQEMAATVRYRLDADKALRTATVNRAQAKERLERIQKKLAALQGENSELKQRIAEMNRRHEQLQGDQPTEERNRRLAALVERKKDEEARQAALAKPIDETEKAELAAAVELSRAQVTVSAAEADYSVVQRQVSPRIARRLAEPQFVAASGSQPTPPGGKSTESVGQRAESADGEIGE